jgi:hypothetical protein
MDDGIRGQEEVLAYAIALQEEAIRTKGEPDLALAMLINLAAEKVSESKAKADRVLPLCLECGRTKTIKHGGEKNKPIRHCAFC